MAFHEDQITLRRIGISFTRTKLHDNGIEDQITMAFHTRTKLYCTIGISFTRTKLHCTVLHNGISRGPNYTAQDWHFIHEDQIALHTIAQWYFTRTKLHCTPLHNGISFTRTKLHCTHCTIGLAFHSRGSNYTSEGPFLQVGSKITPQTMRNA